MRRTHRPRVRLVHVVTVPMTLEFLLRGQIGYMKDRGMEVIAVSSPGPGLDRVAARDAIPVYPIPMARGMSPLSDFVALMRLFRLFSSIRPTIVNASTGKAGPLAIFAARLARVPITVYSLRGLMVDRRDGPAKQILRIIERTSCRLADRVLAVSDSVRDFMVGEGLCPREKLVVPAKGSSNGVDASQRFNPARVDPAAAARFRSSHGIPDDRPVIGFVGRVVAGKGVAELAQAWKSLRNRYENAHLFIAGPVELQDPVPNEVLTGLRNDARLTMTEFVPNDEMPLLYAISDVVVLPSYSEGFPNVPLEAAAMSVPVVATTVTGCEDAVVDGVTGTLVPPRDAEALARAIGTYLDHPALGAQHGRAGRERALRDYLPEHVWESVYREYEYLLSERGLRLPEPNRDVS